LETASRDAEKAALNVAGGWKLGDAGSQSGFIYYTEDDGYCKALPPEKAVGADDPAQDHRQVLAGRTGPARSGRAARARYFSGSAR
jgi:hypothetical protein